jgi:hypothetical protein
VLKKKKKNTVCRRKHKAIDCIGGRNDAKATGVGWLQHLLDCSLCSFSCQEFFVRIPRIFEQVCSLSFPYSLVFALFPFILTWMVRKKVERRLASHIPGSFLFYLNRYIPNVVFIGIVQDAPHSHNSASPHLFFIFYFLFANFNLMNRSATPWWGQ